MNDRQDRTVNRRRLLRRAGTVAAGIAGTGVVGASAAGPAQAAPGDPVLQGRDNDAVDQTTTLRSAATGATLRLENARTTPYPNDITLAEPALRLAPSGDTLPPTAEVGSIGMNSAGTLLAVSGRSDGFSIVDFVYTSGTASRIVPVTPQRVIDTRTPIGRARIENRTGNLDSSGRLLAGRTIHVNLGDYVFFGEGVFGNVTVTGPLAAGFLQIFPEGTPRPAEFSTINFQANQTLSNAFFSGVSNNLDLVSVYTLKTTHVIIDVVAFVISYGEVNPMFQPISGGERLSAEALAARRAERAAAARRSRPRWS
ncbi:hypothetical protein Q3W71_28225 [Micromonospora sp. C28SCA-DRY-2]|uniref:hypothetical protein n=1 Tax=Micromonospora sp. C28SCA-DRY-2 TaxID=3059522 RepID=UPI002674A044|nr:hypothetical protein [Micromonospora sp. C28SCA-DRY-2]MDO3705562.1 hypothetical protein [Micromonospora sp. C28SCA-DRY-2]